MSKRLLQFINALIAIMTIVLASMSLLFGVNSPVYNEAINTEIPALDSNLRFFGGLGLGIGLVLLWITPRIEKRTIIFRALWICAFLGGIGRIVSMFTIGFPPKPMIIFTFIEVPLVPILIYWQWRVSQIS
jgi:uncharacterized protein YjeT (DUF2065 family)